MTDVILMGLVMLLVAAGSAAVGYCIGMKNRFDDMVEDMWQMYEAEFEERISRYEEVLGKGGEDA